MTTHPDALSELAGHLQPVLDQSPDGIYLWLDERNKVCNERLARMFGYTIEEWEAVDDFAGTFIAEESREIYVWHYQNRVLGLEFPSTFRFRGRRKDGSTFALETDIVPLTYAGHAVAYHFVRQVGD
jgi:PAS domain S-box-containing protein